jgi:hypothetical protein
VQWWLQPKGPETVHRLDEQGPELAYALPEFGVHMPFKPTDFTQVNPHINRVLVSRALQLLDVQRDERVIDWFCGLGNFTLPLATRAAQVLGIEGSEVLVQRARDNARATAWPRAPASRRATCSRSAAPTWWQPVRPNVGWSIRRAKAPSRWPRRWPTCTPRPWPAGSRRGASSTSAATRPRWRATPVCWCTRQATAARRPAW